MLFGRQSTLQVGPEGGQGVSVTGLRLGWNVEHSLEAEPSASKIEVYNPADTTIALLQQPRCLVRLLVGYDVPRQIFQGHPIKHGVTVERRGPDRVLTIEAHDGGAQYQGARVSVSFATETSLRQVFDAVAAQLGLPLGSIRIADDVRLTQGVTLAGPAREVLDRIAVASSADWTIRDGALVVVPRDGTTGEPATVFSSAQGNLIGSPAQTKDGVEITGLIDAGMRPGKPFQVESERINGLYRATRVTFQGDSGWETPFYVKIVGKPYGG